MPFCKSHKVCTGTLCIFSIFISFPILQPEYIGDLFNPTAHLIKISSTFFLLLRRTSSKFSLSTIPSSYCTWDGNQRMHSSVKCVYFPKKQWPCMINSILVKLMKSSGSPCPLFSCFCTAIPYSELNSSHLFLNLILSISLCLKAGSTE